MFCHGLRIANHSLDNVKFLHSLSEYNKILAGINFAAFSFSTGESFFLGD